MTPNPYAKTPHPENNPLMPFTVIGDPNLETSLEIVKAFIDGGAHALELGFPFSDPSADGPTIQAADVRALKNNLSTEKIFDFITKSRALTDIPIGLLTYYNPVFKHGVDEFYQKAAEAGLTSILIADLPPEEAGDALNAGKKHGIQQIFIVSEHTTAERLKIILEHASGFLYVVSQPGVTGARQEVADTTVDTLKKLRTQTDLPLYVGFGISEAAHVQTVIEAGANCAIVGSALVKTIEANLNTHDQIPEMIRAQIKILTQKESL
jgi:tryptophan synthase alpha chain